MRVIFFDIDGTLTTSKISEQTFEQHPYDVKILPGVVKGLEFCQKQGYKLIGISNQDRIAANRQSIDDAILEMNYTLQLLPQLESIYFCPDFAGKLIYKVCLFFHERQERHQFLDRITNQPLYQSFWKPSIGMIEKAVQDLNATISDCWMIGDRAEDQVAAADANINFLSADVWRDRFCRQESVAP